MQTSSEFESELLDVIKNRRSRRPFSNQPVEPEKIKSLFEAARWAPSSSNEQPWMYVYATKEENPELFQKIFEPLNDSNKVWVKDAPLLIASMVRKHFIRNHMPNVSAHYDLGAANALLGIQATALGLNVHQIGGYNYDHLRKNLSVPDTYDLGVVIAVGYLGSVDQLSERLKNRELAPRQRYVQSEFVRTSTFEKW
jgi:nitroreductase